MDTPHQEKQAREERRKECWIVVRVTKEEREQIHAVAAAKNLTTADLVRSLGQLQA